MKFNSLHQIVVEIFSKCYLLNGQCFWILMQWRIQDFPLGGGGADRLWGADLRRANFSAKMYAKTKEMDPVGGACASGAPWIRQ